MGEELWFDLFLLNSTTAMKLGEAWNYSHDVTTGAWTNPSHLLSTSRIHLANGHHHNISLANLRPQYQTLSSVD